MGKPNNLQYHSIHFFRIVTKTKTAGIIGLIGVAITCSLIKNCSHSIGIFFLMMPYIYSWICILSLIVAICDKRLCIIYTNESPNIRMIDCWKFKQTTLQSFYVSRLSNCWTRFINFRSSQQSYDRMATTEPATRHHTIPCNRYY
jgi:hypothetical protein